MRIDEMKQIIVASANANRAKLTTSIEPVRQILDASDVVFGVWNDAVEPDGVGMLLIKGHQKLREIMASGTQGCAISGIPCINIEQAEALRQVLGEQDQRH